ncbi:hypothetical protein LLE49_20140 [Alicyclobacillus tolerans]|uniref:hypothetical protein n=1 Tax=Alicyclobacillus tolerans TaxID=90970 RepID=UPI001F38D04A|nr:hypothetical protein [Alicyclobacillus tolerans]MCF8567035.1 hypothetical protein [Alicyclobacillus tolerans]
MTLNTLIVVSVGAVVFVGTIAITVSRERNKSKRRRREQTGAEPAPKKNKKETKVRPIQEFLPIDQVESTGELVLTNDAYRRLIQVGNVNPYALSDAEGRSIREHFRNMLEMFRQPIQFIVRGRRMDLTDYRQYFSQTYQATAEKWESDRLLEYGRHVEAHLVEQGNRQRTIRENLFVTTADAGLLGERDVGELRRTLHQETDNALSGLTHCRVTPKLMSAEETIESFQFFWNRDRLHARARDAVTHDSLREYLVGEDEVKWHV